MDSIEKASLLMGTGLQKRQGAAHSANVTTITGVATSDSADGAVRVDLGGTTISDEDEQAVELPTTCDVREGDTVQIQVAGADGTAKSLLATGVIAGGDRTRAEIAAMILSVVEEYGTSPDPATPPTSWQATAPTWQEGVYIWTHSVITRGDGSIETTDPICTNAGKGESGDPVVGIQTIDVQYYLSTSSTTPTGGTWSTTAPTWEDGRYMWSKTITTLTDGSATASDPVCITGAQGKIGPQGPKGDTGPQGQKGATGTGVQATVTQYYLSTSNTTPTGGSWSTEQPAWVSGKYLWTRDHITWTTGATTDTAPVLAAAINAANTVAESAKTEAAEAQAKAKDLQTLIRETDAGIEVGKVEPDGTYDGYYALVNARGSFDVVSEDGVVVSSMSKDGMILTSYTADSSDPDDETPIVTNAITFAYNNRATGGSVYTSKESTGITHVRAGSFDVNGQKFVQDSRLQCEILDATTMTALSAISKFDINNQTEIGDSYEGSVIGVLTNVRPDKTVYKKYVVQSISADGQPPMAIEVPLDVYMSNLEVAGVYTNPLEFIYDPYGYMWALAGVNGNHADYHAKIPVPPGYRNVNLSLTQQNGTFGDMITGIGYDVTTVSFGDAREFQFGCIQAQIVFDGIKRNGSNATPAVNHVCRWFSNHPKIKVTLTL